MPLLPLPTRVRYAAAPSLTQLARPGGRGYPDLLAEAPGGAGGDAGETGVTGDRGGKGDRAGSVQQAQSLIDGKVSARFACLGRRGHGERSTRGSTLGTGRRVAVKLVAAEVLAKGPDIAERFRREAMASGAIESQYIAQVLDTGDRRSQSGSPYIVMELLVGEDLQHAIQRVRRFTPDIALRITAQACMGLQKAHETGVIHRDVKPANLYLTRRDHEVVVKLLDFGIAKVRLDPLTSHDADRTQSGMMLGSPLYMSPEQARGKKTIDHRSDIFSLGVVLYEMLAGKTPHAKSETIGDLIVRICGEPARPVQEVAPSVNSATAAIVHGALVLDVSRRRVRDRRRRCSRRDPRARPGGARRSTKVPSTDFRRRSRCGAWCPRACAPRGVERGDHACPVRARVSSRGVADDVHLRRLRASPMRVVCPRSPTPR